MTFLVCILCYNRHMQTKFDLVLEISENYFAEFDLEEGEYLLMSVVEKYPENDDGTGETIEYRVPSQKCNIFDINKSYAALDDYLSAD